MARSTKEKEEPKLKLPVGHPQAGYISPDLSLQDDTGVLPDVEQEWHDERDEAQQAEVEVVTENEDKTARDEAKAREEQAEIARERAEYLEKEKYGPTAGKLPGDASYKEPEEKKTSPSKSSS